MTGGVALLLAVGSTGLSPRFLLLSHGSKRPEAWAQLDVLARDLRAAAQADVVASAVFFGADAEEDGSAAEGTGPTASLDTALRRMLEADAKGAIRVLPFIIGPSRALRVDTPRIVREVVAAHPGATVDVLPCLSAALGGDGVQCLSRGLAEQVQQTIVSERLTRPRVYVCDHGSADPAVAAVRREMAAALGALLGDSVLAVEPAPMERPASLARDSAADDPLLEERLAGLAEPNAEVVVAMAFVSPGRHAGVAGDVATILQEARRARPELAVHMTELLGDSAAIRQLLVASIAAAGGGAR